jgi:predicted RNA-binding protein with TRAM domain
MSQGKHRLDGAQKGKFKKRKVKPIAEGSTEDVLLSDIKALRLSHSYNGETDEASGNRSPSVSRFDEVEVDIVELGSSGIHFDLRTF